MSKHTPGPWEVDGYRVGHPVGKHGFDLVARILQTDNATEDAANARLIAAAPDLLAACKAALESDDAPFAISLPLETTLREAIAKAEGVPAAK